MARSLQAIRRRYKKAAEPGPSAGVSSKRSGPFLIHDILDKVNMLLDADPNVAQTADEVDRAFLL